MKFHELLYKLDENIKNMFKPSVKEGMEDDCGEGQSRAPNGDCRKDRKTVEIFFTYPLVIFIMVFLYVLFYTATLGMIKSYPLKKVGGVCKYPSFFEYFDFKSGKYKKDFKEFNRDELNVITKSFAGFKPKILGADFFPEGVTWYGLDIAIFGLSCWNSEVYGKLKKNLFKTDWNTPDEAKKISKGTFLSGLATLVGFMPYIMLQFAIYSLAMLGGIVADIASRIFWICGSWASMFLFESGKDVTFDLGAKEFKKGVMGKAYIEGEEGFLKKFAMWFIFIFGGFGVAALSVLVGCISSIVTAFAIFLYGIYNTFIRGFINFSDAKDPELFFKVLLNNIWDYKYILALFASLIWISQFDFYTRGDENIFKFINGENRQMVTGLLAGISTILFIKQLVKYYSSIKSQKAPRTETCGP